MQLLIGFENRKQCIHSGLSRQRAYSICFK